MPAIFFLIVLTMQIITANYSSTVTQCAHHYDIYLCNYISWKWFSLFVLHFL